MGRPVGAKISAVDGQEGAAGSDPPPRIDVPKELDVGFHAGRCRTENDEGDEGDDDGDTRLSLHGGSSVMLNQRSAAVAPLHVENVDQ